MAQNESDSNLHSEPGLTWQGKPRTCGFRLSRTDVVVIVLAAIAGAGAIQPTFGFSLFVPFVVFHFFLFCNVFRIRRNPELVWAGIFLLNCLGWIVAEQVNLFAIFGSQLFVTALIVGKELRYPGYHGIFARKINPRIDDYLAGRI